MDGKTYRLLERRGIQRVEGGRVAPPVNLNHLRDLFSVSFDVLLHDLTSTYFEINAADAPESGKRAGGPARRSVAGLRGSVRNSNRH